MPVYPMTRPNRYNLTGPVYQYIHSGNALAKTVLKESGEEYSITNSVLTAVYGAYVPYDIAMAQSETETLYFIMSEYMPL